MMAELQAHETETWVKNAVSSTLLAHESIYSQEPRAAQRPPKFLQTISQFLGASYVGVFVLQTTAERFLVQYQVGAAAFTTIPANVLVGELAFTPSCKTYVVDACSQPNLQRLVGEHTAAILSTFLLDGVPGFVLYLFRAPPSQSAFPAACGFASREIFHLVRGTEVRSRFEVFEHLAQFPPPTTDRDDAIWEALAHVKDYFGAEGVSLVEYLGKHNELDRFKKTYIHHVRKETEIFETTHGYAVESILANKALLILRTFDTAQPPYACGLAFDPSMPPNDPGTPVTVYYTVTPKTVESEASLMYCPIVLSGELTAGLKVASFSTPSRFDPRHLRTLAMFCRPIAGLLLHLRLSDELHRWAVTSAFQERMQQQAELLFYYREITQGVIHQLANHISVLAFALAELQLQLQPRTTITESAQESVANAIKTVKLAKSLIADTHARGVSLKPNPRPTQLVAEVVRPALAYAQERLEGTGIALKHTLTASDYEVELDPKLAKEGLINLLTNAIWAVKAHKQAGKREIFVAVREDSATGTVRIEISDSGIGMPKEVFERVARFEPFVTFREGGTGLGLYFTQRLVVHFRGRLQIVSSQPGKGTTVTMTVPIKGG